MSPWSDTTTVWHRKLEIRCCIFFVQRIIQMEWTATQLVTVCLHDAGTRNELGPVDVLKSCQGRWPVYFAQSPSTPPHSLHQQVSAVQLNMQQPRWVRRFQWNGLGAIQCASILGLADRAMIPWFTEPQSTRSPDIKRSSANWCSCSHAACDT